MPSVHSTSSDDLSSANYDNINGFLLTESQIQSSQDVRIYFSPEEVKKAPSLKILRSEEDEEEESVVLQGDPGKLNLSEESKVSNEHVEKLLKEKELLEAALDAGKKEALVLTNKEQFVRNLLKLNELDLKALCNSNKIKLRGQAKNKRNNYIVKLLEHMYDERSNPL